MPWKSSATCYDHHGLHLLRYLVTLPVLLWDSKLLLAPTAQSTKYCPTCTTSATAVPSSRPPSDQTAPRAPCPDSLQAFDSTWVQSGYIFNEGELIWKAQTLSLCDPFRGVEPQASLGREQRWALWGRTLVALQTASLGLSALSPEQVLWSSTSGQGRIWILCNNGWGCFTNNELSVGEGVKQTERATHSDFWLSVMTLSLFYSCLTLKTCFEFVIAESSTKFKRVNVETTPPPRQHCSPTNSFLDIRHSF